jgi:hypothetical protein
MARRKRLKVLQTCVISRKHVTASLPCYLTGRGCLQRPQHAMRLPRLGTSLCRFMKRRAFLQARSPGGDGGCPQSFLNHAVVGLLNDLPAISWQRAEMSFHLFGDYLRADSPPGSGDSLAKR